MRTSHPSSTRKASAVFAALICLAFALASLGCGNSSPGIAGLSSVVASQALLPTAVVPTTAAATATATPTPLSSAVATDDGAQPRVAVAGLITAMLQLPMVVKSWCTSALILTHIPPYASSENLQGRVTCVDPSNYAVAVYIKVGGWWNKPYWASPKTTIGSNGAWTCDITTSPSDVTATQIAAFLVPKSYDPPLLSGDQTLPAQLYANSVAQVIVKREPVYRQIEFAGYTWNVKTSDSLVGPGPNYFSDEAQDVWVDAQGRLHLKIVKRDGRWYSTEVYTDEALGLGQYTFQLASRVDQLDPNIVLGLFTWDDDAPEYNYREIDIEFGRWGQVANDNSQFVVQPWQQAGNMYRFDVDLSDDNSTHGFEWGAASVYFQSLPGHQALPGPAQDEFASWTYTGADVPPAGGERVHINLWLLDGAAPTDSNEAEVIISDFAFAR